MSFYYKKDTWRINYISNWNWVRNRDRNQKQRLRNCYQKRKKETESRIDTSLELLADGRVPRERIIIKMQQDEQKSRDLQDRIIQQEEVKAPTAEDLKVLRDQLRSEVERY